MVKGTAGSLLLAFGRSKTARDVANALSRARVEAL